MVDNLNWKLPAWRIEKIGFVEVIKTILGIKGCTSILSIESSASRVASFPVSRRKLLDRECFVKGATPLAPVVRLSFADGKFEKTNTEK